MCLSGLYSYLLENSYFNRQKYISKLLCSSQLTTVIQTYWELSPFKKNFPKTRSDLFLLILVPSGDKKISVQRLFSCYITFHHIQYYKLHLIWNYILNKTSKEIVIPGCLLGSKCGGITKASWADVERFRTASSGFCIVANTEHCRSPRAAPMVTKQLRLNLCLVQQW